MTRVIRPGLLVLHGNRLELLLDAVSAWLQRNPLDPLEEEVFLVQSSGAGEWLKMSLARETGVCAATRVELPGRFLWTMYRRVLGADRVLPQPSLEKDAITWRLMRLLPTLLARRGFEPVAAFLAGDDADRRLQLARRLADLYDQYQVYRADWLANWEHGRPLLGGPAERDVRIAPDQRWQMELWRALLDELARDERASTRPAVHRAFLDALADERATAAPLPRRIVLFGAAYLPVQALEALAALATRVHVVVAVPNPCRFHWADIIEGREALRTTRRRQPTIASTDPAAVPLETMHLHAHPLLAAWGRQGRDFMRQLDVFDDAEAARERFDLPRIDVFDEGPGTTLLEQVQAGIRDLVPLAEHPRRAVDRHDRSIVFHVAHGPQREVEILHDQLLTTLAGTPALQPRDVIVMVPDIEVFAPSIRAVFGQYPASDPRHIPFDIADLQSRGSNPLIVALEWLLGIADRRIGLHELRDLIDVPAVARRVGIDDDAVPGLFDWLAGAGVRWGLHEAHRGQIGLGATGEQNSWLFGLRRMLLGYAIGRADRTGEDPSAFADIEPYDEIGGLDAASVGAAALLCERLETWWSIARGDATPIEWASRCRTLLATFFGATDEREQPTMAALQSALATWLQACEAARFADRIPLSIVREAWLGGIDGLDASRRFLTGGVTFCTLLPLRAVPFDAVCLLGMNDGDFPRRQPPSDFDLMTLPGQQRPGDRSRRDDDRYLMLEALLSARRLLYVGWSGRSARDNSVQPPSVLVAQLRDYLGAAWHAADGGDLLDERTTEHPLQPFSRRYFEDPGLTTWAREWSAAHAEVDVADVATDGLVAMPPAERIDEPLTIRRLARFLKNPVREFFDLRLDVRVWNDEAVEDHEAFDVDGREGYRLREALLARPDEIVRGDIGEALDQRLRRLRRSGRLPLFELGSRVIDEMTTTVRPMLDRWIECHRAYPRPLARHAVRVADLVVGRDLGLDDTLDDLRSNERGQAWIAMTPSRLLEKGKPRNERPTDKGKFRNERLVDPWVRMLATAASGLDADGLLIGCDVALRLRPLDAEVARRHLEALASAWLDGMSTPLPFAAKTALAFARGERQVASVYDGGRAHGEGSEFCLRRQFPDFEALQADGRFATAVAQLFSPMVEWIADHVTIVPRGALIEAAR